MPASSSSAQPPLSLVVYQVVEHGLYQALREQEADKVKQWWQALVPLIEQQSLPTYGRLWSNWHFVALWKDALENECDYDRLSQQLTLTRTWLLRQDANVGLDGNENSSMRTDLEQKEAFSELYESVLRRLTVQVCLSELEQALESNNTSALTDIKTRLLEAVGEDSLLLPAPLQAWIHTRVTRNNSSRPSGLSAEVVNECRTSDDNDWTSVEHMTERIQSLLLSWSDAILDPPALLATKKVSVDTKPSAQQQDEDMVVDQDDDYDGEQFLQTQVPEPETGLLDAETQAEEEPSEPNENASEPMTRLQQAVKESFEQLYRELEHTVEDDQPIKLKPKMVLRRVAERGFDPTANKEAILEQLQVLIEENHERAAREAQEAEEAERRRQEEEEESSEREEPQPAAAARVPSDPALLREAVHGLWTKLGTDASDTTMGEFVSQLQRDNNMVLDKADKEVVQHLVVELIQKQNAAEVQKEVSSAVKSSSKKRHRIRSASGKKKVARLDGRKTIEWEDSDEEKEEADLWEDSPPDTKQSKPSSGHQKPSKRGPFSDAEVEALREGIRRGMKGKWNDMRTSFDALKDRTGVQIKDKYRNMVRSNQI